jgi:hypothetical protein
MSRKSAREYYDEIIKKRNSHLNRQAILYNQRLDEMERAVKAALAPMPSKCVAIVLVAKAGHA